jgi:ABC-type sugar transport system, periplasmic component
MKKKLLAILLIATMVLGLTGCGGNSKSTGNEKTENVAPTESAATTESAEANNGEAAAANNFADKKHVTLKMYMFGDADTTATEAVSKALSKITNEKLNCDVELTRIGFGSYVTQMNLLLSSGEQVDLFPLFTLNIATLANSGQIHPITDLLPVYANETFTSVSDADWSCGTVGKDIYAFIPNKDKAADLGFMMRKDILDKLGIDVNTIKDFDDLHDVLTKVKEAYPDMYPVVPDYANMYSMYPIDNLGDYFGVLMDPYNSDSLTVENYFASDDFMELCKRSYQWAKEGLFMPDASTNTESGNNLIKSGKAFGRFSHMKVGFEAEQSTSCGTQIVCWRYTKPLSYTGKLSSSLWSVGENSVDYERSVALLNLMYTDPEISNLLINGIEGVHYEFTDDSKQYIKYPEGKDASSVGYTRLPWGWPNEQISYLWEGDSQTLWSDLNEFNESAAQSPAKGFIFDNSNVLNEVTACSNVYTKYFPALVAGQLDPDKTIPIFLDELDKAGLKTIMEEKQKQLNDWAAQKQ